MATSFDVFYLGTVPDIDPREGNGFSENAGALVGRSFGDADALLVDQIHRFSVGSTGYSGGGTRVGYDTDNFSSNDTFRIDGGADQVMDGMAAYAATLTYADGTTGTVSSLIVFQDTAGKLYIAPELSYNSDQIALEAKPIRSVTFDRLVDNNFVLYFDRYEANFAVCFTAGTLIRTPRGEVPVQRLRVGDLVTTMDNGPQPIRWIGSRRLGQTDLLAAPELRPVRIPVGCLGNHRDLLVSPQHGLLLGQDHLVRAIHAAKAQRSGIRVATGRREVTYFHLMFDAHQIIFAEGAPSESFYPGPMAQRVLAADAMRELRGLFPDVFVAHGAPSGAVARAYGETVRAFLPKRATEQAFLESPR